MNISIDAEEFERICRGFLHEDLPRTARVAISYNYDPATSKTISSISMIKQNGSVKDLFCKTVINPLHEDVADATKKIRILVNGIDQMVGKQVMDSGDIMELGGKSRKGPHVIRCNYPDGGERTYYAGSQVQLEHGTVITAVRD